MNDVARPLHACAATTGDPPEGFRLSHLQRGMLIEELQAPRSGVNVMQMVCTLPEAVQPPHLHAAWQGAIARHPVLRTSVCQHHGDEPLQFVHASASVPFEVIDLRDLPAEAREERWRALLRQDRERGFDLSAVPAMRLSLVRFEDARFRLLWTFHHILLDGASFPLLLEEVFSDYAALAEGREIQHPPRRPHRDYVEGLLAEDTAEARAYWKTRLEGLTAPTPLVVDRAPGRPHEGAPGPRRHVVDLPASTTAALKDVARRAEVTLNTLLLGAWAVLLARYAGEDDVLFGETRGDRPRALEGGEGMVGLCITTTPVRIRVAPEMELGAFLRAIRGEQLAARPHQRCPLWEIQAASPIQSGTPLFESLVAFDPFILEERLRGVGGAWESRAFELLEQPGFPLNVHAYDGASLRLQILYDPARFEDDVTARMLGHLQTLLEGIVALAPGGRVADLPLLPEDERRRVVVEWNATRTAYPRDATIHALFEAQAARTPGAPAVTFAGRTLTYDALNRRANQLAHRLRALGVRGDAPVGLFARRSIEMIVATIAVLKAGGAYVPLDPELPDARLGWIVADAGIDLVVAAGTPPRASALGAARVIDLAELAAQIEAESELDPAPVGAAEGLAYVMYTSGSTGTPKGVCVVHRGVVRLVKGTTFARLDESEVFLQLAPIAFDAATLEIWAPLLNGGRLVVPPPEPPSLEQIGEAIRTGGVTTLWLTAGLFNAMIDACPEGLRPLRQLLAGGEALSVPHVAKARRELPGVTLINGYGPTENTTFTACHTIGDADLGGPIPIGRPVANTTVYILDHHGGPAPIGVPGELHAGGDGLARGYLARPELTAERFVADPFAGAEGARLYKTGDRARFRPDGTIEFLGRRDHQVKLRGFRIELGEIEAVLAEHPAVRQALAAVREDAPGERRLVAYLVAAEPAAAPPGDEVRRHAQARLPGYMVPSALVWLPALPVSPNGKIDRAALPAPEPERRARAEGPAGPVSAAEAELLAIWRELLPGRSIGVKDDFFALGGHSLLAARMFHRIATKLGKELPLSTLFEAPTIRRLAQVVAREGGGPSWNSLVAIQGLGTQRPFFCVHAVGGNVLFYRHLARRLGADQPFYALQSRGLGGGVEPHTRIEDMAADYLAEVRSVQPEGPYALGGSSSGGVIAYEMAQQLHAAGERVDALVLLDTYVLRPPTPQDEEALAAARLRLLGVRPETGVGKLLLRLTPDVTALVRRARALVREKPKAGAPIPPAVVRVTEANHAALREYVPRPYPGSATMVLARGEPGILPDDQRLAWADLVQGGLTVRFSDGDHESMLGQAHADTTAAALAACLRAR